MTNKRPSKRRRQPWWLIAAVVVIAAAAGGWYLIQQGQAKQAAPAEQTVKTARVRTGDIVITANGSGNLLPATQLSLAFRSGGVLAELPVAVGQHVADGEALARLDDADARAQVAQAEVNLRLAELKLANLAKGADATALAAARAGLAAAEADLARLQTPPTEAELTAARQNLASAQAALVRLQAGPTAEEIAIAQAALQAAEINVQNAQAAYDRAGQNPASAQAVALWQATTAYEKAQATYTQKLAPASSDQIAAARAKVAQAQGQLDSLLAGASATAVAAAEAKLAQAHAQLDNLLAGVSPEDREVAELGVKLAELSLANAQRQLANTVLTAPIAGVVTEVRARAGEAVGGTPLIVLADLGAPLVRFWVEEADLLSVAPGNPVKVVFEALPDLTFNGQIVRVDPALVTVSNTPAVQAWASIDLAQHPVTLLSGMTAEVEVVAGEAKGALLAPVQAVRELAPGAYAVFVVEADGSLALRPVTVGLRDFANAEILSGLQRGDVVSTGTVATE